MTNFFFKGNTSLFSVWIFLILAGLQAAGQGREFTRSNFPDDREAFQGVMQELSYGDYYYDIQWPNYPQALYHYRKAMDFNPDNARLNYRVGVCYLNSVNSNKAPEYLKRAIELGIEEVDVYYQLGKAYQQNYRFEEAIEQFNHYMERAGEKGRTNAERRIAGCYNAMELMKYPVEVVIENAGEQINSAYDDYRPLLSPDGSTLYFTSRRPLRDNAATDYLDRKYYENVFVSPEEGSTWAEAKPVEGKINTSGHESAVGVWPDGRHLLIYRGDKSRDVYKSTWYNREWTRLRKLPRELRSPGSKETSIVFTSDGRRVFFISDRDGGVGGKDIWTSIMNSNGRWGEATNLGSHINTPLDEEGLYLAPDNVTLYFSSQGHNSMGGFDVFKTVFRAGMWSKPENLGYPVNTPHDDLFFVMSPSGDEAWYTSMRPGGNGGFDIYRITFAGEEK